MRSFKSYLVESLTLLEGLRSDFKDIPLDVFNKLVKADPTTQPGKPGSYSRWILKLYNKTTSGFKQAMEGESVQIEHFTNALNDALSVYNKAKTLNKIDKRNIDDFKTFGDLYDYLHSKNLTKDTLVSKREKKKDNYFDKDEIESHDGRLVYQNKDWAIIVPETHEASVYYGLGTPWCVSVKSSAAHYNLYTSKGPMYFILSKKERDPKTGQPVKYGFNFPGNEFKDSQNHQVVNRSGVEEWVTDNMGEDVWEALDAEPKSLADLVSQKGLKDPEVKEKIEALFQKIYNPAVNNYDQPGKWYEFANNKYKRFIGSELYLREDFEKANDWFIKLYVSEADIKNGLRDPDSTEKLEDFFRTVLESSDDDLYAALENYYDVKSTTDTTKVIHAMIDDTKLMKDIGLYYKDPENAKYFDQLKDDLIDRFITALYMNYEYYSNEEDGDMMSPNFDVTYLENDGKLHKFSTEMSADVFSSIESDNKNIVLVFDSEDRFSVYFAIAADEDNLHHMEPDGYFDEKIEEVDHETIIQELLDVIKEYIGTKQYQDPRQLKLDLQTFQAKLGQYLTESEDVKLEFAEAKEKGILFKTGTAVEFPFIHNTEKAPYYGDRFQQDIEPAGMYVTFDGYSKDPPQTKNLQKGVMKFHNPLVIPLSTEPNEGNIYDHNSWKINLQYKYNKIGKKLSAALKKDGYDGIVTIDLKHKVTSEIVKL